MTSISRRAEKHKKREGFDEKTEQFGRHNSIVAFSLDLSVQQTNQVATI